MIIGIIHKGSGIGDQLFSYIATRVRAADLGVDFGFVGKEFFKGANFMNLDFGKKFPDGYHVEEPSGKVVIGGQQKESLFELNKPYFNPEFNFIPDNSVIDGYGAQDIRYFEHRLDEVKEWLKVEPLTLNNENLIINFRGGEYQYIKDLFLPFEYWSEATMKTPDIEGIEIHTDDPKLARLFWDESYPIISDIEKNWKALRFTTNAVISNSAFAIIPRLLAHEDILGAKTIAPKYWAGRNVGEWRRPGNYYKQFTYI